MPGFCRAVFVCSILLCLVHVGLLYLWLTKDLEGAVTADGLRQLALDNLLLIVPAGLILVFGLLGNTLLLAYKRAGLFFSWIMVLASFCSILFAMFVLNTETQEMPAPVRRSWMLKGLGVTAIRYAWLAVVIVALKRAGLFLRR